MKRRHLYFLASLFLILVLHACSDDVTENRGPVDPDPVIPNLTQKVTSSVTGFVTDESGEPVVFAVVTAGNKTASTDQYGFFKITNASLTKFAGMVQVSKGGFFDGYTTFEAKENKEEFVRFKLLTKTKAGTVSAAEGGTATTADGGQVTLPANGIVVASSNATYTGQVHVHARVIGAGENNELLLSRPGDFRGTNENGHTRSLRSISTLAVELVGDGGQALQIMDGKSATINLPIPSDLQADAPETITLWSFDTATGLWKEEGTATKNGNAYSATVSHFSFWEGAESFPLVNFTARIVDAANQPLVHVPVSITFAGMPKNAGYGRSAFTDADGYVSGAVFANKDLVLDILTPCALSVYEHEFSTTNTDIDLGTLTGNMGQNLVTLHGTVSDCEEQPVTSGYIQTYDGGFYNRIPVVNGSFTFTGVMCTNTEVSIVAVNNATYDQNTPESVSLTSGNNDLGALTACGTSTMGHITFTLNGTTVNIIEPADTVGAYYAITATQFLTLSGDPNDAQRMSFQVDGGPALGDAHKVYDIFSSAFPSGRGYSSEGLKVNFTEYGKPGGFISGEFSGNIPDFEGNEVHTISCSFRVRRMN